MQDELEADTNSILTGPKQVTKMSEVGQVYYQQKWWEGTALTGKHMRSLKRAASTAPPLNSKQK